MAWNGRKNCEIVEQIHKTLLHRSDLATKCSKNAQIVMKRIRYMISFAERYLGASKAQQ